MKEHPFFARPQLVAAAKAVAFVGGLVFLVGAMRVSLPSDAQVEATPQHFEAPQPNPLEPFWLGMTPQEVEQNAAQMLVRRGSYFTRMGIFESSDIMTNNNIEITVIYNNDYLVNHIECRDPKALFPGKNGFSGPGSTWEAARKCFPKSEEMGTPNDRGEGRFLKIAPYTALRSWKDNEKVEFIEISKWLGPSPTKMYQ